MKERLLDVAESALKLAESMGATQAEVYASSNKTFSIDVENNAIKGAREKRDSGCGVRTVFGKGVGFAYVTTLLKDDVEEAVRKSVQLAKSSIPDPSFASLPSFDGSYSEVKGLFDKEIESLASDDAAELVLRTVDATKAQLEGVNSAIEAHVRASSGWRTVTNSLGISGYASSTSTWLYSYPTIKTDGDQNSSYEFQLSRKLSEIEPEWIGKTAAKNALANLGGKTIEGGVMPVIFAPLAVGTIIGGGFGGAVNAEEVQYGRSYIADALGEEIGSVNLEIIDNALLPGGLGSHSFDAEGYPSQSTEILTKGVLKNLLHNSYTANKDQVENTGNASRPSYAGTPSISTSNFIVTPGKGTLEDLISETGRGIVCRNTGDRPNMTTGDLSAMVMEGSYFENGEIRHSVKNTLIGINMRDLIRRVGLVGADVRTSTSVVSPSIVIESAKITSG
jgi:PmbA protein